MSLYEVVFALRPRLDEEKIKAIKEGIQSFVGKNEGKLEKFMDIGNRKLAYEVKGEEEGYFVRGLFSINSTPLSQLLRWVRTQDEVIRIAVTKKSINLLEETTERRK